MTSIHETADITISLTLTEDEFYSQLCLLLHNLDSYAHQSTFQFCPLGYFRIICPWFLGIHICKDLERLDYWPMVVPPSYPFHDITWQHLQSLVRSQAHLLTRLL